MVAKTGRRQFIAVITMVLIALAMGIINNGCGSSGGGGTSGSSGTDTTPPTVSFTSPVNLDTDVFVNTKITVTFSEAMDPATISTTTFTLTSFTSGSPSVTGVMTYDAVGNTATFTPASNLASSNVYMARMANGVKDLAGNALTIEYVWTFTTGIAADTIPPTVSYINPANLATGVVINKKITASFSEAMDSATITTTTFTLTRGTTSITGTVIYAAVGATATFTPASNLASSTVYTATLTTGVKDLAGNALASNCVWSFTTGAAADTIPPTVTSINPVNLATGVVINKKITATFSEAMDPATIKTATFTLTQGTTSVVGVVTYAAVGATATFTPASNLASSTVYTATLTTGVKDLAGNALASNYTWSFTTGATADTTPPTVISTSPANLATGVFVNGRIDATFSEAMGPTTINTTTFTVIGPGATPVTGTVALATLTATFDPTNDFVYSTVYTATLTTGVKDLAGNALAVAKIWSFTTGASTGTSLAAVVLGTAGNFAVLAKTGVSTTGATHVTGDIGLSPAAATYITGFGLIADSTNTFSTSSLVTGRIYAADYTPPTPATMTTAVSDMETAFTDAAGRTLPDYTELYAGDISGRTLVSGLYKWGTGVLITDVGVTLTGSATDVWIFQIAQDLTVSNGAIITLSGGALPQNIFWQVSGQTTLGTTANFKGIILCQTLIEMQTGATLNGRALAQTAVTLDATAITVP